MDWALVTAAQAWLVNPWLLWGVGPVIAAALGYILTVTVLEWVLLQGWLDSQLLSYSSNGYAPRKQLLVETHKRIPHRCA